MNPGELNVAADYLEEGGFEDTARLLRGQAEAAIWDSYVRAALSGAAVINSSYGKSAGDVATFATDVAYRCLNERKRRYPDR